MDTVTFWKHYGRDLEQLLDKAHDREAARLSEIINKGNHYLYQDSKHDFSDFGRLKMIRSVVIGMNRSEDVDSQAPLKS